MLPCSVCLNDFIVGWNLEQLNTVEGLFVRLHGFRVRIKTVSMSMHVW